tara:strand:- start:68 stop:730 length:663 start_codon:yes stop_codon:yes gene_type:complete
MGNNIHITRALPKSKRNIESREVAKDMDAIIVSKKYDFDYFDGDRKYGYGGYKYDGRWVPVAKDIINHFKLKPGDKFLDIGCAKGFLMKDLIDALPGLEVFGLDISEYAIKNCHEDVIGRIHKGSAKNLLFPDNAFDAVISLDTIHNLNRNDVIIALKEIQRVTKGDNSFVKVDSYKTPEEKKIFESWVLTAEYHDYPKGWLETFKEAGYTGDYDWTIIK